MRETASQTPLGQERLIRRIGDGGGLTPLPLAEAAVRAGRSGPRVHGSVKTAALT
ncbi:MAG: hypothetical protein QNK42_05770 [Pseudodonghicola sp.]|nr:hypothetical protein [Pseudodonghicola sp.]